MRLSRSDALKLLVKSEAAKHEWSSFIQRNSIANHGSLSHSDRDGLVVHIDGH